MFIRSFLKLEIFWYWYVWAKIELLFSCSELTSQQQREIEPKEQLSFSTQIRVSVTPNSDRKGCYIQWKSNRGEIVVPAPDQDSVFKNGTSPLFIIRMETQSGNGCSEKIGNAKIFFQRNLINKLNIMAVEFTQTCNMLLKYVEGERLYIVRRN